MSSSGLSQRAFKLYRMHPWFPIEDYAALYDLTLRVRPASVLEFGPGTSTLAFVEAGVGRIVTCEDVVDRVAGLRTQFEQYGTVTVVPNHHPAHYGRFDLGFVDGPVRTEDRGPNIAYALAHCDVVAVHDARRDGVRQAVELAFRSGRRIEYVGANIAVWTPC